MNTAISKSQSQLPTKGRQEDCHGDAIRIPTELITTYTYNRIGRVF